MLTQWSHPAKDMSPEPCICPLGMLLLVPEWFTNYLSNNLAFGNRISITQSYFFVRLRNFKVETHFSCFSSISFDEYPSMTKSNLERKGLISSYNLQGLGLSQEWKQRPWGNSTDLLPTVYLTCFAQPVFLYSQGPLPRCYHCSSYICNNNDDDDDDVSIKWKHFSQFKFDLCRWSWLC